MSLTLSTSARNARADATCNLLDAGAGAGTIKIYSGTRPATPNTALSGNTLLATVTLTDPAFGAVATGVKTLGDPGSVTGVAAGTATFFRAEDSTGAAVMDGKVTATGGGGDLTLATTTISVGLAVDVTGGTFTEPVGTAD